MKRCWKKHQAGLTALLIVPITAMMFYFAPGMIGPAGALGTSTSTGGCSIANDGTDPGAHSLGVIISNTSTVNGGSISCTGFGTTATGVITEVLHGGNCIALDLSDSGTGSYFPTSFTLSWGIDGSTHTTNVVLVGVFYQTGVNNCGSHFGSGTWTTTATEWYNGYSPPTFVLPYGATTATSWWGGISILPVSGPNGECTPTSETGFYSATGDGSTQFVYTYTYTGAVQAIVGDTTDGSTPALGLYGQYFANDSDVQTSMRGGVVHLTVTPVVGANPNNIQVYCYDAGQWYSWGTSTSGGSGSPPSAAGCGFVALTGPFQGKSDGSTYTYNLETTGSGSEEAIAVNPNDSGTGTITVPNTDATTFPGDTVVQSNPHNAQTLYVPIATGTAINPIFWCYSLTTNAWINLGSATTLEVAVNGSIGIVGGFTGGCFDLIAVFETSGMSWTNPVSWVTGLAKDVTGVGEWLVIPCSSTWHKVTNQFGIGSNTPGIGASSASQWLGNVGYLLTVGPYSGAVAIQTAEAGGATTGPMGAYYPITTKGSTSVHVSAYSSLAALTSGAPGWVNDLVQLLTTGLLVLFFILIVRWIRKVLGSSE